jgi:hypothetical protein
MHAKDYEVYKVALDAAKERAAQRRAKLEKETSTSKASKEQVGTGLWEACSKPVSCLITAV